MADQFYTDARGANRRGDVTHSSVTCGAVSTQLAAANANRRYLLIQNTGPGATVYLRFDEGAAVMNQGYALANGQAFEFPRPGGNALYRGIVNGISAAGTEVCLISEA